MKAKARLVAPDPYKSGLEREWAEYLAWLRLGGEIENWIYEGVTLKLANDTRYTPDFLVITKSGGIECHETKGHMREAARVRLNVAAHDFPWFTFVLIRKIKGEWVLEEVKG